MISSGKIRDIYVLTRVYDAYLSDSLNQAEFFSRLKLALRSIQKNVVSYRNNGNVILIINDDTDQTDSHLFQIHKNRLNLLLKEEGFLKGINLFFTESKGKEGSAAALFRIRNFFIQIAKAKSIDLSHTIVVSLDQDDELCNGAFLRIANSMKPNGLVLSAFEVKDNKNLDITDDGGRVHNRLSRFLWLPLWIRRTLFRRRNDVDFIAHWANEYRYSNISFINKIQKHIKCLSLNIHRLNHRWLPVRDFIYASTIGWTKSYSGEILERYINDIESFFSTKRPDMRGVALEYFKAHPAYEDFLDFYVFLYKDLQLSGTLKNTHKYIKRRDSITSTPTIQDFRDHRTASLINLVDMCFHFGGEDGRNYLRIDYQYKLLRHISVKILQIEAILSKYRKEYDNGSASLIKAEFAKYTHDGYFLSKLTRLIRSDNRGLRQDNELFDSAILTLNATTLDNFISLYSRINDIREYDLNLQSFSIKYTMMKACESEQFIHQVLVSGKEESIEKKYDRTLTPKQKQYRMILLFDVLIISVISSYIFSNLDSFSSNEVSNAYIAGTISIMVAVLTFSLNETSKLRTLSLEEISNKRLYYSEFEDLIRHLEANMKIVIQIIEDMNNGSMECPTAVHLNNLKWPTNSCLFYDEMTKIIDKDKVDDFARLKVNLRNINNSAQWLYRYSESPSYSKIKMQEMLNWELTRYFGYYINFLYMKEHQFVFPSQYQLDTYIADRGVRNKLCLFFMCDSIEKSRKSVDLLISRYYEDRREKRSVLSA